MPFAQDILTRINKVHWASKEQFLYSGDDGMFGSSNGESWKKADHSVPAISLAWMDDVWVGCGTDGSVWRSEDGAQNWSLIDGAPKFVEIVSMRPKGTDEHGKPRPGVFAGWLRSEDSDDDFVYTSQDLGKN